MFCLQTAELDMRYQHVFFRVCQLSGPSDSLQGMGCALWVFFPVGSIDWMCQIQRPRQLQHGTWLSQGAETSLKSILWKVSNRVQNSYADRKLFLSSFKDKTIKLWKITERDKRPEGYNLKDEEGKLKDLSTVTSLQVRCCFCPGCSCMKKIVMGTKSVKDLNIYPVLNIYAIILEVLADCIV